MPYRIVVAVDGSRDSIAALDWALAEAAVRDGEVAAVFAWQMPFLSFPGAVSREDLERAAKDFLNEVVRGAAPWPAVPLTTIVAEGYPAEALIVASRQADLLVMGSRGHSPLAELVVGSVSHRCAAAASCPVVLVRQH